MTVSELIRELKKNPPGSIIRIESNENCNGVYYHDNIERIIEVKHIYNHHTYFLLESKIDDPERKM